MRVESEVLGAPRQQLNDALMRRLDRAVGFGLRHWLALFNTAAALFTGLPVLAALMMKAGVQAPALWIYSLYAAVCHQLPGHSYFLFGYQVCLCQRCLAIYGTAASGGLLYALVRRRVRPAPWRVAAAACVPIAIDAFTQMFGWRESDWLLRTLTGAIFALGALWLVYPRFEKIMARDAAPYQAVGGP